MSVFQDILNPSDTRAVAANTVQGDLWLYDKLSFKKSRQAGDV